MTDMTHDEICETYNLMVQHLGVLAGMYEARAKDEEDVFLGAISRTCRAMVEGDNAPINVLHDLAHLDVGPSEQVEALTHVFVMTLTMLQDRLMGGAETLNDPDHIKRFYRMLFDTCEQYRVARVQAEFDPLLTAQADGAVH